MKKTFLLSLIAILAAVCDTVAQKPVYIYRSEGFVSSFITEEIDSITYSRMDADSVMQPDYCTTVVHTCDTVYRIPIASIDSISFITPSTVLKQGVFNIDDRLLSWVTGCDGLSLTLKSSTPANLLPKTGETIVSVSDNGSPFGGLFLGKVSEITTGADGITIRCDPASFEDGFERYYGTTTGYGSAPAVSYRCN